MAADRLAHRCAVAIEICDWMVAELGTAQGGFASSLDADTAVDQHHVEGLTYVWTPDQLAEVLGPATPPGRPSCSASPRPARSSTAPPHCA